MIRMFGTPLGIVALTEMKKCELKYVIQTSGGQLGGVGFSISLSLWFRLKIFATSADRLGFFMQYYCPGNYKIARYLFEYRLQMFTEWVAHAIRWSAIFYHDVSQLQCQKSD
jgi:hypothetical protein